MDYRGKIVQWDVCIPLESNPLGYTLCTCDTPEAVQAVIAALVRIDIANPREITVKRVESVP